jgi:hypothetical protein
MGYLLRMRESCTTALVFLNFKSSGNKAWGYAPPCAFQLPSWRVCAGAVYQREGQLLRSVRHVRMPNATLCAFLRVGRTSPVGWILSFHIKE